VWGLSERVGAAHTLFVGTVRRIWMALLAFGLVLVAGTVGYLILGFGLLEAVYQTVTTVSTVGFREVRPLGTAGQAFTIVLILIGVGTALYTFGVLLESLIEGHLRQYLGRRRMDRDIARMNGHVIICGWGRVGGACAQYLSVTGQLTVVVDRDPSRLAGVPYPTVLGDVTDDQVLQSAGISRARALVAALNTDADNVYVTLSSRALRPVEHRRRQRLRHAVQPRPSPRHGDHRPGPHRSLPIQARPRRRRSCGQPATDRRTSHGSLCAATARGGVPRRGHA